jgi:hypothetical protein
VVEADCDSGGGGASDVSCFDAGDSSSFEGVAGGLACAFCALLHLQNQDELVELLGWVLTAAVGTVS